MATVYTPNAAHTPATITVPDDGDNLVAGSATVPLEDLADLVANARLNAAKTNIDNHFTASQSITGALHVSGGGDFAGQLALNGGRAQLAPSPFVASRVQVDLMGNASNVGAPFFRTYLLPTGGFELTVNAYWDEAAGHWTRDATGPTSIKYAFTPDGLAIFSYSGSAATVDEAGAGAWNSTADYRMPYVGGHPAGAVFGLIADNTAAFSKTPLATYLASAFPAKFATAFGLAVAPTLTLIDLGPGLAPGFTHDVTKGRPPKVFKDVFGVVHLQGTISGTSSPVGEPSFTLPAGYRPGNRIVFAQAVTDFSGGYYPALVVAVSINTNGEVTLTSGALTGAAGVSLEGITFLADA